MLLADGKLTLSCSEAPALRNSAQSNYGAEEAIRGDHAVNYRTVPNRYFDPTFVLDVLFNAYFDATKLVSHLILFDFAEESSLKPTGGTFCTFSLYSETLSKISVSTCVLNVNWSVIACGYQKVQIALKYLYETPARPLISLNPHNPVSRLHAHVDNIRSSPRCVSLRG